MRHDAIPTEVRQFKGLWIPMEVLALDMPAIAKILWSDIHSFTGEDSAFFKSNETIAKEYQCSVRTISRCMTMLKDHGLIVVVTDGRRRYCTTTMDGSQNVYAGSPKCPARVDNLSMQGRQSGEAGWPKSPHRIQYREQSRKQDRLATRNFEDVKAYFEELGMDAEEAAKFFDYYETNGWKQGKGKAIKDWKAAARNWKRNAKQFNKPTRGFNAGNFTIDGAIDFVNHG